MMRRVVVVGSGLAGIAAGQELRSRGVPVTVFERSSCPGGRMATRRSGEGRFDQGAAFFTVRDPRFREAVDGLVGAGRLRPWAERLYRWDGTTLRADPLTARERRWAAPEGMAAVAAALAEGLAVEANVRVTRLEPAGDGWRVFVQRGENPEEIPEPASSVVVALPAPAALALVRGVDAAIDSHVLRELARVAYDPCLVLLAKVAGPRPPWEGIASESGPVQWIGCESSKRTAEPVLFAVHGAAEWSRERFDAAEELVVRELLQETARIAGAEFGNAVPVHLERWPCARPTMLATARALLSEAPPMAFCGDWGGGPRAEGAWLSGLAAVERLAGAGYA